MNKKRLISAVISAAMVLTVQAALYAEPLPNPTVSVDDKIVVFEDQEPVISENDDTLIPLRGVLEAMGAMVEWNEADRSVYVKSKDNITRMLLTIDNSIMTKYTLKTITTVDSEEIELSTAPRIMNDRTMVPLRVVSENMGAQVDWDDAARHITIKTKEYLKYISENTPVAGDDTEVTEYNPKDILPYLYLEADKTEVKTGDTVTVDVKLANSDKVPEGCVLSGLSAVLFYDSQKAIHDTANLIVDNEIRGALAVSNPNYFNDSVKYVCVIAPSETEQGIAINDGTIARFTFIAETDEEFDISIANRVSSKLGSDTHLLLTTAESKMLTLDDYKELYIDTTPIYFNK